MVIRSSFEDHSSVDFPSFVVLLHLEILLLALFCVKETELVARFFSFQPFMSFQYRFMLRKFLPFTV